MVLERQERWQRRERNPFKGFCGDGSQSEVFGGSGHPDPQLTGSKTLVCPSRGEVDDDAHSASYLPRAERSGISLHGPGSGLGGSGAAAAGLC